MQRCLIVDDEMPAREELKYILNSTKDVEVIGEASHGMEALELIDKLWQENYCIRNIDQ